MFSNRTAWDLSPNAFSLALQRARRDRALLDLTQSNPTSIGLPYPDAEILAAIAQPPSLTYEPTPLGHRGARQAIADTYRDKALAIDPSRIALTSSSSEAYAWLLKLLCDPGDSILVPRPSYPLFDDLARIECVELKGYGLLYDGRWHVDIESIRHAVGESTRAVFVVSPNNPTGSYLHRVELAAIEEIARARGLAIVSDEVFEDYVWVDDPARVACVAAESRQLSFSLGGLSKSVCLPQMKLGWIVVGGPESDASQALGRLEMLADTFLSVGTPVQHAARSLLELRKPIQEQLRTRIRSNLGALRSSIGQGSALNALEVAAGWYAVLRVPRVMTDEQWAVRLVLEDGVVVHPGSFFGFQQEGYLVVSLIAQEDLFAEAIRRVVARVAIECGQ
ncbi:MAG: pyridoxal phosphate-dependent aminotransferase [Deltaproteobacteria bacterium]|nr:pyridoxal phosphate-dependent aminotransferase [Deltaproteobacteria bacterium]